MILLLSYLYVTGVFVFLTMFLNVEDNPKLVTLAWYTTLWPISFWLYCYKKMK